MSPEPHGSSRPRSFVHELRDRKVFRAAATYAAVGFVLWQVGDYVLPALGFPSTAVSVLVVLTLAGFPVVLALAWMIERTDAGWRIATPGRRRDRVLLATISILALLLATAVGWVGVGRIVPDDVSPGAAYAIPAADDRLKAIAVLPFDNYSPDSANAYFAAGITEEITSQLSKIADLRVVSRTAVERMVRAGKGPADLARELGIGTMLEGSVRQDGGRVRVTAQLIDVGTQHHLWAEDYDGELADVLAVQSDIALRIADALAVHMSGDETRRIENRPTSSIIAYELYQQARRMPGGTPERFAARSDVVKQVLALDPTYADAWGGLAQSFVWQAVFGRASFIDSTRAAAARALELDPEQASALHAIAITHMLESRPDEARREFLRGHSIAPGDPRFLADLAIAEELLGNYPDQLYWSYRSFLLDPASVNMRYHATLPLVTLGEVELTRTWLDRSLAMDPDYARTHIIYAGFDLHHGRVQQAATRIREYRERHPGNFEVDVAWADLALFTDLDAARRVLETLYERAPDGQANWFTERTIRTNLAFTLRESGARARADSLFAQSITAFEKLWRDGARARFIPMELAAIHAALGRNEEAYLWLDRGYENGYHLAHLLAIDPMFAALRGEPRFGARLARMREDLAAQLEQARRQRIGPFRETAT